MKRLLAILALFATPAAAQTYTQMQWGRQATSPFQFGANIGGTWFPLGTINSSGAWSIPSSNISGLGSAATLNVGTIAGTVAAGDDARITGAAQKSANLSDLASAQTARANLGLGSAATQSTGSSGSTIPLLSGVNTWSGAQTFSAGATVPFTQTGTGAVATTIDAKIRETVSVTDFGADPTGVADSAPAFTAAIASNRDIIVPAGTYTFRSKVSPPSCALFYACASDDAAVLVQNKSNFRIIGYGAKINIASNIPHTTAFLFFKTTEFVVEGLTIVGNRTGLTANQENVAITIFSGTNFEIRNNIIPSGFEDNGAAFAGDWQINGKYYNNIIKNVGICGDIAFLKNVEIAGNYGTGGATGGGVGNKCWSSIYDTPNALTNNTGVAFTDTDGVFIHDNYATNFVEGMLISSGKNFTISHNRWENNPGKSPTAGGYGILIYYIPSGSFPSTGFPPSNILIDGDTINNNGGAVSGAGIRISCNGITNSDVVENVSVVNTQFNNNTSIGLYTDCTAASGKASNFTVYGNNFSGANQTTSIDANTFTLMPFVQQATSGAASLTTATVVELTSLTLPAGQWAVSAQSSFGGGATTTVNSLKTGISTTTATIPSTVGQFAAMAGNGNTPFSYSPVTQNVGPVIYNVTSTTTVRCNAVASFGVSTATAYCNLVAKRLP